MNGIDNLTSDEKQAIEELKKRTIHDLTPRLLEDESLFYRFLTARDFNLKNAEAMLRKHFLDRKFYRIEEIINGDYTPTEHITTYWAVTRLGHDKEGSIVRYLDVGGMDTSGVCSIFTLKQIFQYIVSYLEDDYEILREKSKQLGKSLTAISVIMNMDKLSLYQVTNKTAIEMMLDGFKSYQDNYPERIKKIYIINAAIYFTMPFTMVKAILASALLKKIQIFGRSGWQEAILKDIDADVLPAFLGGNRTDPDGNPMCNSFVLHGKPVPEELYKKRKKKCSNLKDGMKKLIVNRFSSHEICFSIYEPNTCIEWEFETKTRDIGFGLYYKDSLNKQSKAEELVPKQRIDTMLCSETGLYNCDKAGTYIVVFDNSYSWIHSKEIYYKIHLTKPEVLHSHNLT